MKITCLVYDGDVTEGDLIGECNSVEDAVLLASKHSTKPISRIVIKRE